MKPELAQQLAEACASTLYERDAASQAMGIRLLEVSPGSARVSMEVRADMVQGVGTCHGGYLFALADSAFAFACNTYNATTVALGCSIDYVSPARLGDRLVAHAIEQSRGSRTGNYDVRIENQQGALIALFHGKSYQVRGTLIDQETPNE